MTYILSPTAISWRGSKTRLTYRYLHRTGERWERLLDPHTPATANGIMMTVVKTTHDD